MTRNEFLEALRHQLAPLPQQERENAVRRYEEYFDAAASEEEALLSLGSPEALAARILADAGFSLPAKKKRDPMTVFGLVLLILFASPLLFALAAAALALLAVLCSVTLAVVLPMPALSLGLLAGCVLLFDLAIGISGFFAPGTVLLSGCALLCGSMSILYGIASGHILNGVCILYKKLFTSLARKKGAAGK